MFQAKDYIRATSLDEAYEWNQKRSSVLVGGMMWLKMGKNQKGAVIDISGLELDQIEETEEEFRIGCMCSLRQLECHEGLNQYFGGIFRECTRYIVGTQFRNMATVGGSVFGRYGFSDILTCLMMLDTYVELHHGGLVSLEAFSQMKYDRDILVHVIIRKDGRKAAYTSQRRSKTDFPLLACGVAKHEGQWIVSVGARPDKAFPVVWPVSDEPLEQQAGQIVSRYPFHDNMRGSGEYRRRIAEIYVRRLMEELEKQEKLEELKELEGRKG